MPYVSNPDAPPRDLAEQAARVVADNLRESYPGFMVRVEENIRYRFEVVVELPFRVETRTWAELHEDGLED